MDEGVGFEALLTKLRESRLSTDERRTTLDTLRQVLPPLIASTFSESSTHPTLLDRAIQDGPNDVRRVVLQTFSLHIDKAGLDVNSNDQVLITVHSLFESIESFLRSTLKIQSSKSVSLPSSRSSIDISNLSTSALRATAAALKALHSLLRIIPKQNRTPSLILNSSSKIPSLVGLFDLLLPCIFAGTQEPRQASGPLPRSTSSLQSGAFSWSQPSRPTLNASPRTEFNASNSAHSAIRPDNSSSGETDRKSDKSESERSDFSTASFSSIRSSKAESRQQESTTKLIRQNALYCLAELNRLESRSLISRWGDLLPDQPATRLSDQPSQSAFGRTISSTTASGPPSLCTIITMDPSTSVRLAAISALESILTHGTLQLSMAQERAQRALSFTSLSSQLAGWIVNIRSYVIVALQRAVSAPRAAGTGGEAVGYPSLLTIALLQLTRTFVVSTAKAKLVTANAVVLGPAVVRFASHTDPDVQTAAKRLLAALSPAATTTSTKNAVVPTTSTAEAAANESVVNNSAALTGGGTLTELTALLSKEAVLDTATCERFVAALEEAGDPVQQLPSWTLFVKALADASSDSPNSKIIERIVRLWQKLSTRTCKTSEQQCTTLSSVPDLWKVLSRSSMLDEELRSSILQYAARCCGDADEAIRAAAVRVQGLLVLPSDTHRRVTETPCAMTETLDFTARDTAVQASLHDALWDVNLLHDKSSLVRQRAAWAFSNAIEAHLRSSTPLPPKQWLSYAQYCLEAARDIEGVAVSACRASGSLLALMDPFADAEACSSAIWLLEQLCKVLSTTSKPPKSRWNAASAMERALSSDVVFRVLTGQGDLLDRVVELLCTNLDAKVFKVRVSAANALLALLVGAVEDRVPVSNASRSSLLGLDRRKRISGFAAARLVELASNPSQSKESALYIDELQRLVNRLVTLSSS